MGDQVLGVQCFSDRICCGSSFFRPSVAVEEGVLSVVEFGWAVDAPWAVDEAHSVWYALKAPWPVRSCVK